MARRNFNIKAVASSFWAVTPIRSALLIFKYVLQDCHFTAGNETLIFTLLRISLLCLLPPRTWTAFLHSRLWHPEIFIFLSQPLLLVMAKVYRLLDVFQRLQMRSGSPSSIWDSNYACDSAGERCGSTDRNCANSLGVYQRPRNSSCALARILNSTLYDPWKFMKEDQSHLIQSAGYYQSRSPISFFLDSPHLRFWHWKTDRPGIWGMISVFQRTWAAKDMCSHGHLAMQPVWIV